MADLIDNVTNASSDALGSIQNSLTGGGGLQFPSDLGSRAVHFQVQTRTRQTDRVGTSTKAGATIALPIPSNLSTGYGAQYSQQGLGVLGNEAVSFVQEGKSIADLQQNGIEYVSEQAKAIAASASVEVAGLIGAAVGGPAAAGLGAAGAGIAVGALKGAGLAVNPHLAVLFEGVGFRTHSFQYKFSARSQAESNALADIITTFKLAMHPTEEGKAFFNYPDEFKISFPSNSEFLFKIGTSVLQDFQINYTPDGGSYFHQNGAPVSISMALTFMELDILTKTEIMGGR